MFNLFGSLKTQHDEEKRARQYREVLRRAAQIGGGIFGPVPDGVRREFFCLGHRVWIWHEEWTDENGQRRIVTTRYDVRPKGILKAQDGQPYRYVELEEGKRLYKAMKMYARLMHTDL
jgi:hypothetical protein